MINPRKCTRVGQMPSTAVYSARYFLCGTPNTAMTLGILQSVPQRPKVLKAGKTILFWVVTQLLRNADVCPQTHTVLQPTFFFEFSVSLNPSCFDRSLPSKWTVHRRPQIDSLYPIFILVAFPRYHFLLRRLFQNHKRKRRVSCELKTNS